MQLRPALVAVAVLALSAADALAVSVRLRTGAVLSGDVVATDTDGFRLKRWDNGGVVFVQWEHLAVEDARRVRKLLTLPEESAKEMIEIVRIQTKNGSFLEGRIVEETGDKLTLLTKEGKKTIPSASILKREKGVVEATSLYTPKELYDEKAKGASDTDPSGQFDLGSLCMRLGLWTEADRHFAKALELDPALKDKVDQRRAMVTRRKKEQDAVALKSQVEELIGDRKFKEARASFDKLKGEFGDLVAKADLDSLEGELNEGEKGGSIPNGPGGGGKPADDKMFKDYCSILEIFLKKPAADTKAILEVAMKYVEGSLHKEVVKELARRLKLKPEELEERWEARQISSTRKQSYGEGTWVKEGKKKKKPDAEDAPSYEDLIKAQESDKIIEDLWSKDRRDPRAVNEEWWKGAGAERRLAWLVAYAAETLFEVVEVQWAKCRTCGGKGLLGKDLCKTCLGVKNEKVVVYK